MKGFHGDLLSSSERSLFLKDRFQANFAEPTNVTREHSR